jgi:uncharacterized RDD family membrane protein YckC
MKLRYVRWLFLPLLVYFVPASFGFSWLPAVNFGVQAETSNGNYHFSGGTSPWAIVVIAIVIVPYLVLMYAKDEDPPGKPLHGILRRFAAFWIDFIFAMFVIGPVLGILPVLLEWRRTGVFQWYFERDSAAPGDWVQALLGVALCFGFLLLYFSWPLTRRRPTPGGCILNYRVVRDDGSPLRFGRAVLHSLLGFVAMGWWFIALFGRDKQKGKIWLDKVFNTHAEKLS